MTDSIFLIILAGCWGLFIVVWGLGWIYNLWKAPAVQKRTRFMPVWVIILALVVLTRSGTPLHSFEMVWAMPIWVRTVGGACLIASTALALWARLTLATMWSSLPEIRVDHQLRTDGPYGITRHPIYTGLIGMVVGSILISAMGNWALLALVGIVVFLLKMRWEEELLLETFGELYRQYQQRVPQIIPGLQFLSLKTGHRGKETA